MRIIRLVEPSARRRDDVTEERSTSPYGAPGELPLRKPFRPLRREGRTSGRRGWIPLRWLALWWFLMFLGDFVFYVLLTPIWLGSRGAAWVAEFKARAGADRAGRRRRRGT